MGIAPKVHHEFSEIVYCVESNDALMGKMRQNNISSVL